MPSPYLTLPRNTNQARGIGQYAIDFLADQFAPPSDEVLARVEQFHTDSIACAVSALACRCNAPTVLRNEALTYPVLHPNGRAATCLGSSVGVSPEKAVVANSSAAREWDSNGTNFGYNPARGATKGEFGHNDFYPVAIAAAQVAGLDGHTALRGMLLIDEIRGRLAEVFSLKDYKIDHVVHGAIASAAAYGAMLGADAEQIESAIGMFVAHFVPFRAIRAGKQLSDSKGASAAISAEAAVTCMRRAMRGFVGPADIFRNPQAIFCLFEPPTNAGTSPFDLTLTTSGDDFAVMGMHFKLGLYEHQSAGAIQGLIDVLCANPTILESAERLRRVRITIYEPAFGIIGDPAKRDPQTRQSADHSMVFIIGRLLSKAFRLRTAGWKELMLLPEDFGDEALRDQATRAMMAKIEFVHGGPEFDANYPDGIPTCLEIEHDDTGPVSSGLVMYPAGHARNTTVDLDDLVNDKFVKLASLAVPDVDRLRKRFADLARQSIDEIAAIYDFPIRWPERP